MKTLLIAAFLLLTATCGFGQAPDFAWAKSAGGTDEDGGYDIALDGSGNTYVTGYFEGTANFGNITLTSSGEKDIFIAKYDAAGNVLWAKRAGGVEIDYSSDISVDGSGNSYVTGIFVGTATFGSTTLTSSGLSNTFVAKYDAAGNVLWAKSASGGFSGGDGIAPDGSGNSYVTGSFNGTVSFGSISLTNNSLFGDIFIAKYDAAGNVLWAKSAGGTNSDGGIGIGVDGSGNSYVTGYFRATASFGSTTLTSSGLSNAFVAKYDAAGNVMWAKRAGGTGSDNGNDISADGSGNSYVTGIFSGTATFGSFTLTSSGLSDVFIGKYDAAGNVLWAKKAGGTGSDYGNGIAVDGSSNSYVTGIFSGTATFGSISLTSNGSADIFIAKYDTVGNVLWAKGAGGIGFGGGIGIALDGSGNSYVTGSFNNTVSFGSITLVSSGSDDVFIIKLGTFTGTTEEFSATDFAVWPNPFASAFQLKLTSSAGTAATVILSDILGREVHRQQLAAAESSHYVTPPADLPVGMYLLQVVQGQEVRQLRVVRE